MKTPSISSFQKQIFLLLSFFYTLFSPVVIGQVPQGIPKDNGPIDFSSTANIVIYIVLPVIVLVVFVFWRISIRKKRKEEDKGL